MNNLCALVRPNESIHEVIKKINDVAKLGGEAGIAVVVDDARKVLGVVTDGDIRGAFCEKLNFELAIAEIMSDNFVFTYDDLTISEQLEAVIRQFSPSKNVSDPRLSKVIVCDRLMRFVSISNLIALLKSEDVSQRNIAVYGMGYVGLTLAVSFAEVGIQVVGVDINVRVIEKLRKGEATFYEKGLTSLLNHCLEKGSIRFMTPAEEFTADVHIVSVGTPINENKEPVFDYLENVAQMIGVKLKSGHVVICRSTVPTGTTRKFLIPKLEKHSGLVAGRDFSVAFAPERTVEGDALRELKTLPQIVGGLTKNCQQATSRLFEKINNSIILVESLEAAELVKLINNTFRDTVFSFANELSNVCDNFNLNAFDIIRAANEGYPRNPIPYPSPGVGGICLTKDPHLYTCTKFHSSPMKLSFGPLSREINEGTPVRILEKFGNFLKLNNKKWADARVLLVGVAFKGRPETSDTRNSPGMDLAALLKQSGADVFGFDNVVEAEEIKTLGLKPATIEASVETVDALFFMNNHTDNNSFDLFSVLRKARKPLFFFDGWNLFDRHEIESVPGLTYSTLGYTTLSSVDNRKNQTLSMREPKPHFSNPTQI